MSPQGDDQDNDVDPFEYDDAYDLNDLFGEDL